MMDASISNVIQFQQPGARRARPYLPSRLSEWFSTEDLPTGTAKNRRLRSQRRAAWFKAEALVRYWTVRKDLHSAISYAQSHGLSEGYMPVFVPQGLRWELHDRRDMPGRRSTNTLLHRDRNSRIAAGQWSASRRNMTCRS